MNAFYSLTPDVATLSAAQKCKIVSVGCELMHFCAGSLLVEGSGIHKRRKVCQNSRSLCLGTKQKCKPRNCVVVKPYVFIRELLHILAETLTE
jgi:hypothetical protein